MSNFENFYFHLGKQKLYYLNFITFQKFYQISKKFYQISKKFPDVGNLGTTKHFQILKN